MLAPMSEKSVTEGQGTPTRVKLARIRGQKTSSATNNQIKNYTGLMSDDGAGFGMDEGSSPGESLLIVCEEF